MSDKPDGQPRRNVGAVPDDEPIRIAMWSGPRNISTAMMRSFEARGDCAVSDEPFYAAYLSRTGIEHPMRAEVIASQPREPGKIAAHLLGPIPGGKPIWYQKHMTLHMLASFDRSFMTQLQNAFLIRSPEAVLASYASKRSQVTLADIGIVQQRQLFEFVSDGLGAAPPVVDAADILAAPEVALRLLCNALHVYYTPRMLQWPAGRRPTDGVWAPAWYHAVECSTSFGPPPEAAVQLPAHLQRLADEARGDYEALSMHRLR